jgi:hypothetical protein
MVVTVLITVVKEFVLEPVAVPSEVVVVVVSSSSNSSNNFIIIIIWNMPQ